MSEVLHRTADGSGTVVREDDGRVVAYGTSVGPDGVTVRLGVQLEAAPRRPLSFVEQQEAAERRDAEAALGLCRPDRRYRLVDPSKATPPWEQPPVKPAEDAYDADADDRARSAALAAAFDRKPEPATVPPSTDDPGVRDFLQGQAARGVEGAVDAWLRGL